MIKGRRLRRALPFLASALLLVAFTPLRALPSAPIYGAGVTIVPDNLSTVRVGYPLFGDALTQSPNPVDSQLQHVSLLGTGTSGTAYAGPEHGGTVRATATTADETVGSEARLSYTFQLQAKPGAIVPTVVPLSVFANGGTGTEGYGGGRITFQLTYYDSPTSFATIFEDTGTGSTPGGIVTFGGTGNININEDINVLLGRDIRVDLFAGASAGDNVIDQDWYKDEYGTGSAYLDPVFTLPAAYRDLIDIVGVPGVVAPPPGAVPEPASWAMMLAGFGMVGSSARRRRAARTPVLRPMPGFRIDSATRPVSRVGHHVLLATPIVLSVILSASASAQPTYGPYYIASVFGVREGENHGGFHAPDTYGTLPVASSLSGTDWSVSATADDTNGGTVTANALLTRPPVGQETYISELSAGSSLQYIFTIDGPDASALIPVLFHAAAFGSGSSGGGSVELGFNHDDEMLYRYSTFGNGRTSTGFEVNELVYLHPGNTYSLTMQANAGVHLNTISPGNSVAMASATVDPTFAIQGGFAQLYHFIGLPDSSIVPPGGPTGAVPEPSSWAMFIGGFGLVGAAMRRRTSVRFA